MGAGSVTGLAKRGTARLEQSLSSLGNQHLSTSTSTIKPSDLSCIILGHFLFLPPPSFFLCFFFKGKLFRKCGHKAVPEGPKIILVTLEMIMMILKKMRMTKMELVMDASKRIASPPISRQICRRLECPSFKYSTWQKQQHQQRYC